MEERIDTAVNLGRIPDDIRKTHKGFKEWDSVVSRKDHQTVLEVLLLWNIGFWAFLRLHCGVLC